MLGMFDGKGNLLTGDQVLNGIVDAAVNAEMARSVGIAVTLFNALAIRDTAVHASGALDCSKLINNKTITIVHGFDQNITTVKLTLWNGTAVAMPGQCYVVTAQTVTSAAGMLISGQAPGTGNVVTQAQVPCLISPFQWVQLELGCTVAPTLGTVTAVLYGSAG